MWILILLSSAILLLLLFKAWILKPWSMGKLNFQNWLALPQAKCNTWEKRGLHGDSSAYLSSISGLPPVFNGQQIGPDSQSSCHLIQWQWWYQPELFVLRQGAQAELTRQHHPPPQLRWKTALALSWGCCLQLTFSAHCWGGDVPKTGASRPLNFECLSSCQLRIYNRR